ncbi:MAG: hypothetical protein A2X12_09100 [Bacteroidetes bacterium GWE2_29_8]|nr:MAG: hypothetical protein A2X12_09100 [Bacteroidetes bacterium GWE2_29_8]OFY17157.1 MAG: hypothetical protein A2X02_09295 [Bacteroidetes bacterium GWF2_29_10]
MVYEINGKLLEKFDTVQVNERFKKREFILEKKELINGIEFSDLIKFQATQDRCQILDNINVNDSIKISFNIRGRKWEKETEVYYFTTLEAFRIDKDFSNEESSASNDGGANISNDVSIDSNEPTEDLPF